MHRVKQVLGNLRKGKVSFLVTFILLAGLVASVVVARQVNFLGLFASPTSTSLRMPSSLTASLGSEFLVPVIVDASGNNLVGIDVSLSFDPSKIQLMGVEPAAVSTTSFKFFSPASTNGSFDAAGVVARGNSSGQIDFSASTVNFTAQTVGEPFNSTTQLALLRFKTKLAGSTVVGFNMASSTTNDSNLVLEGYPPVDALSVSSQITNLTLNVISPTATPLPTATATPLPTITPTPTLVATPTATPAGPAGSLVSIRDTYVDSSAKTTSRAGVDTLYVDGSPEKIAYMLFDLSTLAGKTINSAKLSFKTNSGQYSGSPDKVGVYLVENTSWAENVTYSSKPAVSTTKLGEVSATNPNTTYTFDLTLPPVQQRTGGLLAIAIVPTGNDAMYFYSRESSAKPQLIVSASGSGTSAISVFAAGTSASGVYPTIDLLVNDIVVATYNGVSGNTSNRTFVEYKYASPVNVAPNQVKVRFTNDARDSTGDRNILVDKIRIDGVDYQSEASGVYGTGVWTQSAGCTSGNLSTEWLYCNGYFQY